MGLPPGLGTLLTLIETFNRDWWGTDTRFCTNRIEELSYLMIKFTFVSNFREFFRHRKVFIYVR